MPPLKQESWLMSSYCGQVFYPRLFEIRTLDRQGLLTLSGAPGVLRFEGGTYSRAVSPESEFYILTATLIPITSKLTIPVDRSINFLADHSTNWRVTIDDNQLYVSLLSTVSVAGYSPFAVTFMPPTLSVGRRYWGSHETWSCFECFVSSYPSRILIPCKFYLFCMSAYYG